MYMLASEFILGYRKLVELHLSQCQHVCNPGLVVVAPSDPSLGRWMRRMLSASNAATKMPFPSRPRPPSPSSLKVS